MRKAALTIVLSAIVTLSASAMSRAEVRPLIEPDWWTFPDGWGYTDRGGCVRWNWQQRSWYDYCYWAYHTGGLRTRHVRPPVVVRVRD